MRLSLCYLREDDPENLKNWRPISLLNVYYKLIAKVISQRRRVVMPSVIHPDQSCAVPGRSSEDNATLLRDISGYVQSNSLKCAFIAIDQQKSFDYVDWGFMHKVLALMNFGPIIRGIIKCLYTRVQSSILSNGTLSEFFDVHIEEFAREVCYPPCFLFLFRNALDNWSDLAKKYKVLRCPADVNRRSVNMLTITLVSSLTIMAF